MSATETTYTSKKIQIKNTVFSVLIVKGEFNYVSVRKETNNPWKTLGREFKNFDEAIAHYKNPQMKIELLKIETGTN